MTKTITQSTFTEKHAKTVCTWKYDKEFSVYDLPNWNISVNKNFGLTKEEIRKEQFLAFEASNELIAFGRIVRKNGKVSIGIGIKPNFCGQGLGKTIMKSILKEAEKRYPDDVISLEVRAFNKRATKCYTGVGFKVKKEYTKNNFNGEKDQFIYMEWERIHE
ncbi:GNAT family N-acetyltransferase [Clostridiaceae bacterium M8S5]|nr:GNAT family N-acetyltransferase [Clostridiaceae bacterium M8S5]